MRRDLYSMTTKAFDVLVVGGGITGACIARDTAMRGLSVALVEKGDFASATSSASSKLIHGGLRYLQNLELGLVRESLRERRVWSNIAPHLVDPLTFLMPTSSSGKRIRGRLKMALALTAYDWLAYDRNRLDDPEKMIPKHKRLNREETLALEPGLESEDLTGAMIFYDYQMYSPERLALECVLAAADKGAAVANYAEVVEFTKEDGAVTGARVRDRATAGGEFCVRGRVTVNAAGPWADILMAELSDDEHPRQIIRSKGIHILTRSLTNGHAIAVPTETGHFFVLPWRGYSILGTSDAVFEGHPDEFRVTEKDITDFLAVVNEGYPSAHLERSDVLHFYGGLRPIVDTTTSAIAEEDDETDEPDTYSASRAAEVYDHEAEDGLKGVVTTIGGKWTTSRSLAEQVVDLVVEKCGLPRTPCTTDLAPTYGGDVGPFDDFMGRAIIKYSAFPEAIIENLAKNYGSRMDDVLALADEEPGLEEQISSQFPDIAAQVVYAVRNEMALGLDDILFRRTGLGTLGSPGDTPIAQVVDIMTQELGWDEAQRNAQLERALAYFVPAGLGTPASLPGRGAGPEEA